jgi:anti-anti-sigma factor
MSVVHTFPKSRVAFDVHAAQIHCHHACLTAEASNRLTVISLTGDVDALNAEPVYEHIRAFVSPGRPLVLDLTGLDFLGVDGIRRLFDLAAACAEADEKLAVIAGHAVRRLLRISDQRGWLPTVGSMVEALELLAAGPDSNSNGGYSSRINETYAATR